MLGQETQAQRVSGVRVRHAMQLDDLILRARLKAKRPLPSPGMVSARINRRLKLDRDHEIVEVLRAVHERHEMRVFAGKVMTQAEAVEIALFGVPLWCLVLRWVLSSWARWAWRELTEGQSDES